MVFFLVFLVFVLAAIMLRVFVVGAKLQWFLIVYGTFALLGAFASLAVDQMTGGISMTAELAVMVVTAVVAWKGLELLRVFAEDRLRGGLYWSVRVFEFVVVGAGPGALAGVALYALTERLAIADPWLVIAGGSALVTGIAYRFYDQGFRERKARRLHEMYGRGGPMVYTHPSQFRS